MCQLKNNNEEATIKILGKLTLEFPELDLDLQKQIKIRDLIEEVLYNYDVMTKETSLVATDIEDRLKMYLAVKKLDGLSKLTLKSYKREIIMFSNVIIKPVSAITTMDIRMYLSCICKGKKQSTLANKISTLKSFFGWLEDEEFITKNPTKKIKQPKVSKRLRSALSVEEIELLRDACKTTRQRALLETLYCTGCRLDEIIKLNKSDLDFNTMSTRVIGKGDKERIVYLSSKSKIYLEKYFKQRKDNCEALFVTSRRPAIRLGRRSIEVEMNTIGKLAGLEKSIYPHILRHSLATHALKSGTMSLYTIQRLLGHSSPVTTQIYSELDDSSVQEQYRKLNF